MKLPILIVNRSTPRAVKVTLAEGNRPLIWLPRSQIRNGFSIEAGEEGLTLDISDWIWEQKLAEMRELAEVEE